MMKSKWEELISDNASPNLYPCNVIKTNYFVTTADKSRGDRVYVNEENVHKLNILDKEKWWDIFLTCLRPKTDTRNKIKRELLSLEDIPNERFKLFPV